MPLLDCSSATLLRHCHIVARGVPSRFRGHLQWPVEATRAGSPLLQPGDWNLLLPQQGRHNSTRSERNGIRVLCSLLTAGSAEPAAGPEPFAQTPSSAKRHERLGRASGSFASRVQASKDQGPKPLAQTPSSAHRRVLFRFKFQFRWRLFLAQILLTELCLLLTPCAALRAQRRGFLSRLLDSCDCCELASGSQRTATRVFIGLQEISVSEGSVSQESHGSAELKLLVKFELFDCCCSFVDCQFVDYAMVW